MPHKNVNCPKCQTILEYFESSFEQYEPSIFRCSNCKEEFRQSNVFGKVSKILGFNKQKIIPFSLDDFKKSLRGDFNLKGIKSDLCDNLDETMEDNS